MCLNKRIAVEIMQFPAEFNMNSFNPDTDMNDAFMVVDKMREDGYGYCFSDNHDGTVIEAQFSSEADNYETSYDATADTPQMAICLAALKVKEGEG